MGDNEDNKFHPKSPQSRKSHKSPNLKGFTLSELIIVLAILGVLFTIAGKTYSGERKRVQHNNALMEVLTVIKEARNYSVTSRMAYDKDTSTRFIPKEGYGVYVERKMTVPPNPVYNGTEVVLFVNTKIDTDEEKNQFNANSNEDIEEQIYILGKKYIWLDGIYKNPPTNTIINSVADLTEITSNKASIIFRPPLADTYIADNDDPIDGKIETLYLVFSNPNTPTDAKRKIIKINRVSGFAELISESEL